MGQSTHFEYGSVHLYVEHSHARNSHCNAQNGKRLQQLRWAKWGENLLVMAEILRIAHCPTSKSEVLLTRGLCMPSKYGSHVGVKTSGARESESLVDP